MEVKTLRGSLDNKFDHSEPASFLVSSNSGRSADGILIFKQKRKVIDSMEP